jgi:hypothetical protein
MSSSSSRGSRSSTSASFSSTGDAKSSSKPRKIAARADDLDAYTEKLYDEDVESKLEGAKMILQLAEFAGHTEMLIQNESLMVRTRYGPGTGDTT